MMPVIAASRPCSFDHSYELPLRRNLLLLLDLLDVLRFIGGVLLDRLGVAPCHADVVRLPGRSWDGELLVDAERFLEAALRAPATTIGTRPITAPRYRRRRPAPQPPADDAAVCAICLAGLEAGGCQQLVAELCSCSHAFHAVCIDAWLSSGDQAAAATCPLCRAPVSPAAWDAPFPRAGGTYARAPR